MKDEDSRAPTEQPEMGLDLLAFLLLGLALHLVILAGDVPSDAKRSVHSGRIEEEAQTQTR